MQIWFQRLFQVCFISCQIPCDLKEGNLVRSKDRNMHAVPQAVQAQYGREFNL